MFKKMLVRGIVVVTVVTTGGVAVAVQPNDASAPVTVTAPPARSFPTIRAGFRTAPPARTPGTPAVALYGDSLSVMAWDDYLWITAGEVRTEDHRWSGTNLGDWRDSILSNPNDNLVLALGTNDSGRGGAAPWATLLDELPSSKCIVWPKPYEGGAQVEDFNAQMTTIVAAHPNVHVIDWNSQVQAHPEWVLFDRTHYNADGSLAYAEMLERAARTCP